MTEGRKPSPSPVPVQQWAMWYADVRTVGGEIIPFFLVGWDASHDDPNDQDYLEDIARGEIWGIYDDSDIDEKVPERAASIRKARADHAGSPFITTSIDGVYVQVARAHIVSVRFRCELKDHPE